MMFMVSHDGVFVYVLSESFFNNLTVRAGYLFRLITQINIIKKYCVNSEGSLPSLDALLLTKKQKTAGKRGIELLCASWCFSTG